MTLPFRIPFVRFREYRSSTGRHYFAAYVGDAKLILLRDPSFRRSAKKRTIVDEWILFVEEGWRTHNDSMQARALIEPAGHAD